MELNLEWLRCMLNKFVLKSLTFGVRRIKLPIWFFYFFCFYFFIFFLWFEFKFHILLVLLGRSFQNVLPVDFVQSIQLSGRKNKLNARMLFYLKINYIYTFFNSIGHFSLK
jgi:hypothetical protein